jgi:hypothetical protein
MVLVPDKLKTKKILKRQERERELKKGSRKAVFKGPSVKIFKLKVSLGVNNLLRLKI